MAGWGWVRFLDNVNDNNNNKEEEERSGSLAARKSLGSSNLDESRFRPCLLFLLSRARSHRVRTMGVHGKRDGVSEKSNWATRACGLK